MDVPATNPSIAAHEHTHPSTGVYIRIGLVLFVFTALEVAAYEVAHRDIGALSALLAPILIEVLILLSAFKFALVAMYYMHLKQDSKLFSGVFVFPIIIATFIILALIVLQAYHFRFARTG
jgi:cytochrome c oxidase subunit IV